MAKNNNDKVFFKKNFKQENILESVIMPCTNYNTQNSIKSSFNKKPNYDRTHTINKEKNYLKESQESIEEFQALSATKFGYDEEFYESRFGNIAQTETLFKERNKKILLKNATEKEHIVDINFTTIAATGRSTKRNVTYKTDEDYFPKFDEVVSPKNDYKKKATDDFITSKNYIEDNKKLTYSTQISNLITKSNKSETNLKKNLFTESDEKDQKSRSSSYNSSHQCDEENNKQALNKITTKNGFKNFLDNLNIYATSKDNLKSQASQKLVEYYSTKKNDQNKMQNNLTDFKRADTKKSFKSSFYLGFDPSNNTRKKNVGKICTETEVLNKIDMVRQNTFKNEMEKSEIQNKKIKISSSRFINKSMRPTNLSSSRNHKENSFAEKYKSFKISQCKHNTTSTTQLEVDKNDLWKKNHTAREKLHNQNKEIIVGAQTFGKEVRVDMYTNHLGHIVRTSNQFGKANHQKNDANPNKKVYANESINKALMKATDVHKICASYSVRHFKMKDSLNQFYREDHSCHHHDNESQILDQEIQIPSGSTVHEVSEKNFETEGKVFSLIEEQHKFIKEIIDNFENIRYHFFIL